MYYLAIDIGGTYTKFAVMDAEGHFKERGKIPTIQDTEAHFLDMLVELYQKHQAISGIALSSAGVIDSELGMMYNAGSLGCVSNLAIVDELQKRCKVSVSVENDAKCAALAEVWCGSLSDCSNALVVILGTAVGGAVICDRAVLRGSHCMAGEFSYILANSDDCMNPQKTLAQYCGVPALLQIASEKLGVPAEKLDGKKVFDLANAGNVHALDSVRQYANRLAVQLLNYHFIFDPERIAIGGGISEQPLLLECISEELLRLSGIYPYPIDVPEVTSCKFFNDSNLIGALYVHLKSAKQF
jgi:predicted NBD/HSP70 family sugar kinase